MSWKVSSIACLVSALAGDVLALQVRDDRPRLLETILTQPRADTEPLGAVAFCGGVIATAVDEPPAQVDAGPFQIQATFDASIPAAWQVPIDFAIAEWESVIVDNGGRTGPYPITFEAAPLGGALAVAHTFFSATSGDLLRATITFDPRFAWFADQTPASGGVPDRQFDLLTVTRHELGHALGWVGAANPRVAALISDATFDAPRLNIALAPDAGGGIDDGHASADAHPGEVMQSSLGAGSRRFIALYPTAALPSRAFENRSAMEFVDPTFVGVSDGSATAPWRSVQQALAQGDGRVPLLLAPTRFFVPAGTVFSQPREIIAARGGASIQ